GTYRGDQWGMSVEGVWQFRRQWGFGLRYGRLESDNRVSGLGTTTVIEDDDFEPEQISVMVDFRNSEFSTLRLQYTRDESSPVKDGQVVLQYIMSMGAHGGHMF
ncbi:MAG: hypothetical protein HUJ31_01735, partial [Pseudomonadales bacterium]|nr:hypothetical protein [Pseudomonadales bacterium]